MTSIEQLYDLYLRHPKITRDSRQDVTDSIYFAIRGENFDGNDFAAKALEKGAKFAVVDRPDKIPIEDDRLLRVANTLESLQQLAAYHRSKLNFPVLAITGSNGKTTTKELVHLALSPKFNVFSTPGNYNNHIGIPLSILQIKGDVDFAVLEMGASAQGEIASYCSYAKPDFGLITNIGKAHIEGFGGVEGIKKGKGELFDYLAEHQGMAFVNRDETYLEEMAAEISRKFFFRSATEPRLEADLLQVEKVSTSPGIIVRYRDRKGIDHQLESVLMGPHNFQNINAALAVGTYFDVPVEAMLRAIESYRPSNNRSQILKKGEITYLLDAYNANPSSMELSIRTFVDWNEGKKGLILGDMLELGSYSLQAHQALVDMVEQLDSVDFVYLVGDEFKKTVLPESFRWFGRIDDLKGAWSEENYEGYTILLKGSRSMRLEKLLET